MSFVELPQKGFQIKRSPATFYLTSFLLKLGFQIKRNPATFYWNSLLWKLTEASFELCGASTLWSYTKQISTETSAKKNWNKQIHHKLPQGKSLQNNFQKQPLPKNISGKESTKQIFKEKSSPKPCPKISLPKNICKEILRQILWQIKLGRNTLFKQKLWRESMYQKYLKRNHYQKIFSEKLARKISEK